MQKKITSIDLVKKKVYLDKKEMTYDFLVLAPGSTTNYFTAGEDIQKGYKLDCLQDALRIRDAYDKALQSKEPLNVVISGAGFTGLELATNLYHASNNKKSNINFYLIEKFGTVLPMLGAKRAAFVQEKMSNLGFNFLVNEEIEHYTNKTVQLKSGKTFQNAFFCWCSGVKMSLDVKGNFKSLGDGRIIVDSYLRIPEHLEVFVVGDAAAVKNGEFYIRRAVNFAAMQGTCAGKNISAQIMNNPLKKYKFVDLGWVIPLYTTSVGEAFGFKTKGRLGIPMHYIMCGLKNYNIKNLLNYMLFSVKFFFSKPIKK